MIKTCAIVLHRYAYSDSSWIVKALTEECGIVSFIVKGGKRKESPFKGALDPLATSEVVFRQNPNAELQFVKEATIIGWHKDLRQDLLALAEAQVMAEIVLRHAPQGVPLPEEFRLLAQALDELDCPPGDTPSTAQPRSGIFARWLLGICDLWGYHLDISVCSRCETPLDAPPADFHPETGEIICRHCLGVATPRSRKETAEGLWDLLQGNELKRKQYVENALLAYLLHHMGYLKEIKSLQFLNETRSLLAT